MKSKESAQYSKGILYIIVAAFGFSLMSFFVRLSGDLPVMQKAFFRNLVAVFVAFILVRRSHSSLKVSRENRLPLLLRCAFGTMGIICNFWAIDHINIADANILNKMSPFFAIILSIFILKEIPQKFDIICVLIALFGAILVVKPTAGIASLPALIGLLGGLAAGTAYTYVRKMGMQNMRGPVIVLYFSLFSTFVCLPLMIADHRPMSAKQLLYLILAGVSASLGQIGITQAYRYAPAKVISVFDYTQVIFAALLGAIVFHEFPDALSITGYFVIIGIALLRGYRALLEDRRS